MKKKILAVEDSAAMQMMIQSTLEDQFDLKMVGTLQEAEATLREVRFDLILLDVMLPDGTGFSLCERLRALPESAATPIIFLTGQTELDDRVRGLNIGADDYVLKPFEPKELVARVESQLRRRATAAPTQFEAGPFKFDVAKQNVIHTENGQARELSLTRIEFKLLVHFLRHKGQIFSRAEVLAKVWGESTHVSEHTVDTHISSLRKKLGTASTCLKAIVKQGYRFDY